jgi:hypothetical protein
MCVLLLCANNIQNRFWFFIQGFVGDDVGSPRFILYTVNGIGKGVKSHLSNLTINTTRLLINKLRYGS